MKKFLLKISIFIIYSVSLSLVVSVGIDPFNVFHIENVRGTRVEPNKNYIKMNYILKRPQKFDGYIFIFGSSRVGAINPDKIKSSGVYNMTYSAGLPSEALNNIKTFLKNNIRPSCIYLGVDSYSYTDSMRAHLSQQLRCPYEYLYNNFLHFLSLYINPAIAIRSLPFLFDGKSYIDPESFYRVGTQIIYEYKSSFNWQDNKLKPSLGPLTKDSVPDNRKAALISIREIAEICRSNEIKLIIFTNPMHNITYTASLNLGYFEFLEGLAEISDFWNFSSLNDITLSNDCYHETSHYKAEVGDIIIDIMCNGKTYSDLQAQGFGVKVTHNNIKAFIDMLSKQAEDFRHKNSPAL